MPATYTDLEQICKVLAVGDKTKFEIQNTVTAVREGDLPSSNVFVYEMLDVTDPKQDTFLRVASILDLTQMVRGRSAAVVGRVKNYLSSSFTVQFDDVATGTAAKKVIQARVDQLIKDWIQYNKDFIIPDHVPLPLFEASIVEAAKAKYTEVSKEKEDADEALVDANTVLADAKADVTTAATALANAQIESFACATTQSQLVSGVTAVNAFISACNEFKATADAYRAGSVSSGVYDSAKVTYELAKTAIDLAMGGLLDTQTRVIASCSAKASAVTTNTNAKQAADQAVATAQTEQVKALAAANDASKKTAAALAALLEVCPDFSP
jgi:hypothetical protein